MYDGTRRYAVNVTLSAGLNSVRVEFLDVGGYAYAIMRCVLGAQK